MSAVPIVLESVDGHDAALRNALAAEGLPTDDLTDDGRTFFSFLRDADTVGFGGYELLGDDALVRSVVILPKYRSVGLGKRVTEVLLEQARQDGARHAFLLTSSAAGFFRGLGFVETDRSSAPSAILQTRQAASLCPTSATLLVRNLRE
jgi:N-acetylglutamate synthase-like GNAT family acetyltransferase